jgi:hypothetical protein
VHVGHLDLHPVTPVPTGVAGRLPSCLLVGGWSVSVVNFLAVPCELYRCALVEGVEHLWLKRRDVRVPRQAHHAVRPNHERHRFGALSHYQGVISR